MCGLIVAWCPEGLISSSLSHALQALHHRGPDAQATTLLENSRLYLAHVRLKIIDVSEGANQPFTSPCGRYTLVYNGEIYNYKELRNKLEGYWEWCTQSDTEVLLAAWSQWGELSLQHLVGMFAFAVYDAHSRSVTVVRDRFGIKPLYYVASGEHWSFCSEIPPLLRMLDRVRPNESTIRTYLETGLYDHSANTFFDSVSAVEPGSLIRIDLMNGQWQKGRWYNLFDHVPDLSRLSRSEVADGAEKRIEEAIKSHLVADVEVGLNVSGGVDSSMLVRVALEELGRAHLFTQDYEGYSELPWVEEVSDGGNLHVAKLGPKNIEEWLIPTVRSQAEPFGGVFVCGYNALYRLATESGVTVLLDGNGVDEIFLGYQRYHQIYVHSAGAQAIKNKRADEYTHFWGKEPVVPGEGRAIDGTSGLRPTAISDHLLAIDPLASISVHDFDDPVRRAAAEDLLFSKIPRGLRFNDRVSMLHSRELRVPYLDHRLVEYAFGIPTEMLFGSRGTKLMFRDLLARRAPESVAYATKRSVQSPQREWLANQWRPLVESVLRSESLFSRGWVDRDRSWCAYQSYLGGDNSNSFFIWQWINLELWAREFLD